MFSVFDPKTLAVFAESIHYWLITLTHTHVKQKSVLCQRYFWTCVMNRLREYSYYKTTFTGKKPPCNCLILVRFWRSIDQIEGKYKSYFYTVKFLTSCGKTSCGNRSTVCFASYIANNILVVLLIIILKWILVRKFVALGFDFALIYLVLRDYLKDF